MDPERLRPGELSLFRFPFSCAGDQVNENAYDIRTLARRELPNSSPRCRGGLYAGPYTRYIQTPAFPIALARHDAPSLSLPTGARSMCAHSVYV